MFIEFSEQLYKLLANREYIPAAAGFEQQTAAGMPFWSVQKMENATLCVLQVMDCARCDIAWLREQTQRMDEMQAFAGFRSVMIINLLVWETKGSGAGNREAASVLMEAAEPYMGQEVCHVYWQMELETRNITPAKGQPGDLFGLRAVVLSACDAPEATAAHENNRTFGEIAREAKAGSPFQPKHDSAVWTWVLIVINAVVVLLMYLDGYTHDPLVPARFGAIVPERVASGEYYRLFTAMFVHFGAMHFLMNAGGLAIFGQRTERFFGRVPFLMIYGLSGLCGSAASLMFTRGYAAGASGAVYGLVGAIFVYTRVSKKSVDQLNDYIMLLYIAVGLAMGLMTPNIDNFGHIGGLLAGAALGAAFMARLFHQRK